MGPTYKEKDYIKWFVQPVCTEYCTQPRRHVAVEQQELCISYTPQHMCILLCVCGSTAITSSYPSFTSLPTTLGLKDIYKRRHSSVYSCMQGQLPYTSSDMCSSFSGRNVKETHYFSEEMLLSPVRGYPPWQTAF